MWCRLKRHRATLDETVDTKRHHRVLISSPLGEGLDRGTDRRPNEGEDHAGEDSGQTRDNRYKALARKEAEIFWQLNAIEAVKHVRGDSTGDNTAKHAGISRVLPQSRQQVNAAPAAQPPPWFSP